MNLNDTMTGNIPRLGFGLMRLPREDGLASPVYMRELEEMVDLFLEAGFTYFDTAPSYGDSEDSIKEALTSRYPRESYQLATKLPAWEYNTRKDAESAFFRSLERTGVEYFDYYLLHSLGAKRTDFFDRYDVWDFLEKRKEEGLITHLGFSIHDSALALDEILTLHPEMEFVQLQLNYADWESMSVQSRACYETARRHNKPIIVMEPLKGGNLVTLPATAKARLTAADPSFSPASLALRFAGSLDGVTTVLSGMNTLGQMCENIAIFSDFKPLNNKERIALAQTAEELEKMTIIPCTFCGYCVAACPQNIAIPGMLVAMNTLMLFGNQAGADSDYFWLTKDPDRGCASDCIQCGSCEMVCPQKIDIISELEYAVEYFE